MEHRTEEERNSRYSLEQMQRENGNDSFEDEFAAEVSPSYEPHMRTQRQHSQQQEASADRTVGWIAMIAAIVSLFVWPAILGTVAIIAGFVAFMRGNRALGAWSIVIGFVSLISYTALYAAYS